MPDREELVLGMKGAAAWRVCGYDGEVLRTDVGPKTQKFEAIEGGGWQVLTVWASSTRSSNSTLVLGRSHFAPLGRA
ncbi:MAG: hypothetical protein ACI835_005675 [Planctomycetota bacterium]